MGIASMVIGIVAAVLGFIPFCNYFAFLPAAAGLVLGIVDIVMKNKKQLPGKGISIAGIILNAAAIVIIFVWTVIISAAAAATQL